MLAFPKTDFKTLGDCAFSFTSVSKWNPLPLEIRTSPSLSNFKKDLKTYLFKKSYPNA